MGVSKQIFNDEGRGLQTDFIPLSFYFLLERLERLERLVVALQRAEAQLRTNDDLFTPTYLTFLKLP